jgi:hypothetical protein
VGKNFLIRKIPSTADGKGQWTPQKYSSPEFNELLKDQEDPWTKSKDASSMSLVSNKKFGPYSPIQEFGSALEVAEEPALKKYSQRNMENDSEGHSSSLNG